MRVAIARSSASSSFSHVIKKLMGEIRSLSEPTIAQGKKSFVFIFSTFDRPFQFRGKQHFSTHMDSIDIQKNLCLIMFAYIAIIENEQGSTGG